MKFSGAGKSLRKCPGAGEAKKAHLSEKERRELDYEISLER